jgi:hypothetical protein
LLFSDLDNFSGVRRPDLRQLAMDLEPVAVDPPGCAHSGEQLGRSPRLDELYCERTL